MAAIKHREEVINVKLADVLAEQGLDADAETIHSKGRPDVFINVNGVKIAVEGRHAKQKTSLLNDAKGRIEKGISDISVSVEYEDSLYTVTSSKMTQALKESTFSGAIFYYSSKGIVESHFSDQSSDDLATMIRSAFNLIVKDDVVRDQVALVQSAIDEAVDRASGSNLFFKSDAVIARLKTALAISDSEVKS